MKAVSYEKEYKMSVGRAKNLFSRWTDITSNRRTRSDLAGRSISGTRCFSTINSGSEIERFNCTSIYGNSAPG